MYHCLSNHYVKNPNTSSSELYKNCTLLCFDSSTVLGCLIRTGVLAIIMCNLLVLGIMMHIFNSSSNENCHHKNLHLRFQL
jgi:hypothetical protein